MLFPKQMEQRGDKPALCQISGDAENNEGGWLGIVLFLHGVGIVPYCHKPINRVARVSNAAHNRIYMKVDYIHSPAAKDEDACFVQEDLFGVFDGFNGWSRFFDESGTSGGRVAAEIARDAFLHEQGDLKNIGITANERIRGHLQKHGVDIGDSAVLYGTMFAVARVIENTIAWAQIGDANGMIIARDRGFRLFTQDYDHDKEVLALWKRYADEKKENIRELINEPLLALRQNMNITHGCLNGDKRAEKFINTGAESLDTLKHVIIFTDGLIIPKQDPSEPDDWKLFVDLFLEGGLRRIERHVRDLEESDPKCWTYPRYKQFDDIAAISLSF